jgi:tetratricopeptide (TPR) repeat protein
MPPMIRIKWVLLFFLFPLLIFSQVKTPFVSYDYESDATYVKALKSLKKKPQQQSTTIIKSIAELSYTYKDWDTAIEYYERLLLKAPQAENYFRVAVAAARKSLEVSRFFSVPYIIKARKSVLEAHELQPKRAVFLNLLIRLYAEIPPLFGGSIAFAEKKANELTDIDPLEGAMMQAYIFEVKNNSIASKSKYAEVFSSLKEKFTDPEQLNSAMERDMIFDLGRVSAQYQMEPEMGIVFLDHYLKDFGFNDNYRSEWAYYYRSKIYLYKRDFKKAKASIKKALEINPDFEEGLDFLNTIAIE